MNAILIIYNGDTETIIDHFIIEHSFVKNEKLANLHETIKSHPDYLVIVADTSHKISQYQFDEVFAKKHELEKVLPQLMEDNSLIEADELVFFYEIIEKNKIIVTACEAANANDLYQYFTNLNIHINQWLPFYLILPKPADNEFVIYLDEQYFFLRKNIYSGLSIPSIIACEYLKTFLNESSQKPEKVIFYGPSKNQDIVKLLEDNQIHVEYKITENFLSLLSNTTLVIPENDNLIPKEKRNLTHLNSHGKYWLKTAKLLFVAVIIAFGFKLWTHEKLLKQNEMLDTKIAALAETLDMPLSAQNFASNIQNRQQLLQVQENDHGFLIMLAKLSPFIDKHQDEILKMIYQNDTISLTLEPKSLPQFKAFINQIKQAGFKVEIAKIDLPLVTIQID